MPATIRAKTFRRSEHTKLENTRIFALTCAVLASGVVSIPTPAYAAVSPIELGTAASFGVLGGATVANTVSAPGDPHTLVRGDLGVGTATAPGGFPPGEVTGEINVAPAAEALAAMDDLAAAYADALTRPATATLPGDLIGVTLLPGVYDSVGAVANTGTVTLDGLAAVGRSDEVFIFQINGALTMAAGARVVLANGAQASNVFWQVNGAAGLGAGATFVGTLMAHDALAVGAGTVVNGRAMALTGAISLNNNTIYSAAPTVTIDGGAEASTTTSTPSVSGTSDADIASTVTVTFDGVTVTPSPGVQADGTWTVDVGLVANGIHTVTASVTDAAGNSGGASQALTVDTVPPVVTIAGGAALSTNDSTPTITGTADVAPGSTVTVTVAGQTMTTLVQGDGTWNVTPSAVADGAHPTVASVTDPAGNTGSASQTLTVDTTPPIVAIAGGAIASTTESTPTITGTTDVAPGSTVTVTVAGQTLTTTVQVGGTWTATTALVANGVYPVTVSVTDAAGNPGGDSQSLTVDTVPPVVTIAGGAALSTNDSTPTITGTADVAPGSTVTVTVAGQTMTTLVQGDGTWNVTPSAVADGAHFVTVSVTDPAGNPGSATQSLTVDTTQPVVVPDPPVAPEPPVMPEPPVVPPPPAVDGRVRFTPIHPMRLADTRTGSGGADRLAANGVLRVSVAGTVGLPGDVTAAALNITVVGPDAGGFLTVYPCTQTLTTSTVNFAAGRDVANSTIATLAPDGDVCVYSSVGAHVIVDILGWFSPSAATAMTSTASRRVADTRSGLGGSGRLAAGGKLTVAVGDQEASATAMNVTAVGSDDAGFLTVYPCGTTPPVTSTVNFGPGEARPNNAIVAVAPGGLVCVFSSAAVDVIVDVTAVFSDDGQLEFLPAAQQRVLDTRARRPVEAGGQVAFDVPFPGAVVSAASVNVTATGHTDDGFATTFGCGTDVPDVSTLNQRVGEDNANGAIVRVGAGSTGCVFTSSATNLIVDLIGWWVPAS